MCHRYFYFSYFISPMSFQMVTSLKKQYFFYYFLFFFLNCLFKNAHVSPIFILAIIKSNNNSVNSIVLNTVKSNYTLTSR